MGVGGGGGWGCTVQKPFAGYAATFESLALDAHERAFADQGILLATPFCERIMSNSLCSILFQSNIDKS